jgi:hypothetical protein
MSPSSAGSSQSHHDSAASTSDDISSLQEQGLLFSDSLKVPPSSLLPLLPSPPPSFSPSFLAHPQGRHRFSSSAITSFSLAYGSTPARWSRVLVETFLHFLIDACVPVPVREMKKGILLAYITNMSFPVYVNHKILTLYRPAV